MFKSFSACLLHLLIQMFKCKALEVLVPPLKKLMIHFVFPHRHRNAIYCLMCSKIPISIKGHLEDRCMKGCSAVEIAAQVDIAKESTRVWTATQRVWEYNTLVKLLPDHVSRMAMVKYLIQNGYLILNKPFDEDMDCAREAPGTSDSVTATTSAVATSAVACTASSSPPEEEETDSSETPSSDEKTRDSSRRRLVQQMYLKCCTVYHLCIDV